MKAKEVIWKERKGTLGPTIYVGFVGRIRLFTYSWDVISSKDNEAPYKLYCSDIKVIRFSSSEDLKEYAQKFVDFIIKELVER